MSAPSACPVPVWGGSWNPPKPHPEGSVGLHCCRQEGDRQGGSLMCCVCCGQCVCEPAGERASIFVLLILYFLLLLQELAPLQRQSTVRVELGLPAVVTQNLIYSPSIHVRPVNEEKCTCNSLFFPPSFPFPNPNALLHFWTTSRC